MSAILEAVQNSWLSQWLTSERWSPALNSKQLLETLHFLAFSVQVGVVMIVSIRLLGPGRSVPIADLARPAFVTAWVAFAVVVVTGVLQFVPIAAEIYYRPSFRAKLAGLFVALVCLVWLQMQIRRRAVFWDAGAAVPAALKVLAVVSLLLWPAVIAIARLMYAFEQSRAL